MTRILAVFSLEESETGLNAELRKPGRKRQPLQCQPSLVQDWQV